MRNHLRDFFIAFNEVLDEFLLQNETTKVLDQEEDHTEKRGCTHFTPSS